MDRQPSDCSVFERIGFLPKRGRLRNRISGGNADIAMNAMNGNVRRRERAAKVVDCTLRSTPQSLLPLRINTPKVAQSSGAPVVGVPG
jgi:hypothetical protein